jgi:hypothetical protein
VQMMKLCALASRRRDSGRSSQRGRNGGGSISGLHASSSWETTGGTTGTRQEQGLGVSGRPEGTEGRIVHDRNPPIVHLWHAHAPQMSDGFFSDETRTPFATESLVKENRSPDVHVRRPNIVRQGHRDILWQEQGPRAGSIDVDGLRGFARTTFSLLRVGQLVSALPAH